MMKRMLILLLVVGLASAAFAGPGMVITNETTGGTVLADQDVIAVGDVIKITFTQDVVLAMGGGFAEFNIGVSAGTYNDDAALTAAGPYDSIPISPWGAIQSLINTVDGAGFDLKINALYGDPVTGPPYAGDMAWLTFTATGATTIDPDYGSYDGVYHSDEAFAGVTLVPEPMTIALLGLGGLFLRRRK